jgi:hypothetical protein
MEKSASRARLFRRHRVLDRRNLNYVPLNDLSNQIVNAEDGTGIDSVMVGGRMIVERGRFLTVDYNSLAEKAERAVERMRAANADALALAARLEPVFGSFCIALGSRPIPCSASWTTQRRANPP